MDLNKEPAKIIDSNKIWIDLIKKTHKDEILKYIKEYPHKQSIYIDFKKLDKIGYSQILNGEHLPDYILNNPDKAISDILCAIDTEFNPYITNTKKEYNLEKLNIRIFNLPKSIKIRDIRSEHIGKLIQIEGMISKATTVKPRVISSRFKCIKCGAITGKIKQKYKESVVPNICEECKTSRFEIIDSENELVDAQKMRVSENFEVIVGNEQPAFIDIDIKSDLCDLYQVGNRCIITGILRTFQKQKYNTKSTDFEFYLDTHTICEESTTFSDLEITVEEEEEIKKFAQNNNVLEEFSNSLGSSIYGYDMIKKACVLFLSGGVRSKKKDGNIKRGNIHILLVCDPATAKTEILKIVTRLSPRGIFTTAANSTAGGLTAIAVKDEFGDGSWSLEGGVAVRANNGVCAIDELATFKKESFTALYDVLENGEVNISKAGISATLKANVSVISACNPAEGRFDDYSPLIDQIKLPEPLISRFDIIFKLQDKPSEELDKMIATRMIESDMIDFEDNTNRVTEDFIRKYIGYARQNYNPKFSKEAADELINYYVKERQKTDTLSITARQNAGLQRLSQAHARLRLSNTVEIEDVELAITLMKSCIDDIAKIDGKVDIDNIMGGLPKSSRDLNKAIPDYMKTYATTINNYSDVVEKKELLQYLESQGQDRNKVEKRIDRMKDDGLLIEPRFNLIKIM